MNAPLAISVRAISDIVCRMRGVDRAAVFSARRGTNETMARQIIMWLAVRHTGKSFPEIGRLIGRDHSTVMHGTAVIERQRQADPQLAADLADIEGRVRQAAETFGPGAGLPADIDAEAVARRIIETPRGAVRISVIEIEGLAAAVLAGEALRQSVLRLLDAETPEQATEAIADVVDHVATGIEHPETYGATHV